MSWGFKGKIEIIEQALLPHPKDDATIDVCNAWDKLISEQMKISMLMLTSMSHKLQKDMENHMAYDMLEELKGCFSDMHELAKTLKLFPCIQDVWRTFCQSYKMFEIQYVGDHVLMMKNHA